MFRIHLVTAAWIYVMTLSAATCADDGYDLWIRYRTLDASLIDNYEPHIRSLVYPLDLDLSPTMDAAVKELSRGLLGLLNTSVPISDTITPGAVVIGTPATKTIDTRELEAMGPEGYVIQEMNDSFIVIAGNTDVGTLYGVFHFLKLLQTQTETLEGVNVSSQPKIQWRLLNHWDNLDGTVERGYSGGTIWDWWRLPDLVDPRYTDYARALASLGINGVVVNNVNAKPDILTSPWIEKVTALAHVFRPYGIKLFLSVRFSTPLELNETTTADPLDDGVKIWWTRKADEIYAAIPDFGGWLVKASSEGQPGPGDYGRSHAEGANMLGVALELWGGVVMWRAFVYSATDPEDRAKQAYSEFKPLDGQFADNVIIQVKNGAIDFQPREPFHPLFGGMPNTQVSLEVQLTKEYLGFATHLAYLGPMWEEVLGSDTFAVGQGSTVSRVTDGSLFNHSLSAIAGVSNIGNHRDWTGSHFNAANIFAYGRLAWNPSESSRRIAEEWLRMTFSNHPTFLSTAVGLMMRSREAVANYMTPLGLAHLMDTGHHYGPGPWVDDLDRPEWNPTYYHQADQEGIGFDRTDSGSKALGQYIPQAAASWSDPNAIDERYLLWFHHLPWDFQMKDGRTLWDTLVLKYGEGVDFMRDMRSHWDTLRQFIDHDRFENIAANLRIQEREAIWWRGACVAYFQSVAMRPLPEGAQPPEKSLEEYKALKFPYAPGHH